MILFGLETEYGITRDDPEGLDVVDESIALVRAARAPGLRMRWDYGCEDPHRDARGFSVAELRQDTDEAQYFARDAARPLTFAEIKSDLALCNGARFYNDHAHPEYGTPECRTLRELLRQDAAGDGLVMACAAARNAGPAAANPVRVYKNNTDFAGHSYGCHENYLVPRAVGWDALAGALQAFLVTRQVFAGAGKYGREEEDAFAGPGFQLSQRADFFSELESVDTMQRRPIVNTRDEPHADPAKWRRFHVILGDANLSPYAAWLKVGSTALVLRALAAGAPAAALPRLENPLGALRSISRDASWKWPCRLAGGKSASALDVQREYLAFARRADLAAEGEEAREWEACLDAWETILDDLEREPLSTADRLDWSAKHRLIEEFRAAEKVGPEDPWLRSLDLAYHELDRERGLYFSLAASGSLRLPYAPAEIDPAGLPAPADTRAAVRGACIERFGPAVEKAQWDHVIVRGARSRWRIDLTDLFAPADVERARRVIAAARAVDDLSALPFAKATG